MKRPTRGLRRGANSCSSRHRQTRNRSHSGRVVGGAALATLVAGLSVPPRLHDVGDRVRAVLWVASTAGAGFLAIVCADTLDLRAAATSLIASAGTAVYAAGLWRLSMTLVQQAVMTAALMATAGSTLAYFVEADGLPGLGVWAVGAVWMLFGWGGVLKPPSVVIMLGAGATIFGAMLTVPTDAGIALACATALAVVGLAVLFRDLVLLAVGAAGMLLVLPNAIVEWFSGAAAAPFALMAVGVVLVGAAVWAARRRSGHTEKQASAMATGRPVQALAGSAVVMITVAAVVAGVAVL